MLAAVVHVINVKGNIFVQAKFHSVLHGPMMVNLEVEAFGLVYVKTSLVLQVRYINFIKGYQLGLFFFYC